MKLTCLFAGAAMALALGGALPASASIIVNIDATSAVGTTIFVAAGEYQIEFIGTADGGAYDGWNPTGVTNCTAPDSCVPGQGWLEAYHTQVAGGPAVGNTIFLKTTPLTGPVAYFSTALEALAAYRAAPLLDGFDTGDYIEPQPNGVDTVDVLTDLTVTFTVPEPAANRADNLGGVSLRITAVPEPATWAMMLVGLGGLGAVLRRAKRKPSGVAATA